MIIVSEIYTNKFYLKNKRNVFFLQTKFIRPSTFYYDATYQIRNYFSLSSKEDVGLYTCPLLGRKFQGMFFSKFSGQGLHV